MFIRSHVSTEYQRDVVMWIHCCQPHPRTCSVSKTDPRLLVYCFTKGETKQVRKRRWVVHPINQARTVGGTFKILPTATGCQ